MKKGLSAVALLFCLFFAGPSDSAEPVKEENGGQLLGVCYGPFREDQDPEGGVFPSKKEIEEDIVFVCKITKTIRTYGSGGTPGLVPSICDQAGEDCYIGIWLCKRKDDNRKEINAAIKLVLEKHKSIKVVIVGSEVLLRKDLTEDELIAIIKEVKEATKDIEGLRITTGETWKVMMEHPKVAKAVDFLFPHIYSYWDGIAIEQGAQHIIDCWQKVCKEFPGKEVVIGETGWPSAGKAREKAQPSEENQARFFAEFTELAKKNNIKYFYFEVFDESWKDKFEGNVGANWGIYYSHGKAKPKIESLLPAAARDGIKRPKCIVSAVEAKAPLVIYDGEGDEPKFVPSGWMGDEEPVDLDKSCTIEPHSGKICARISYAPARGGNQGWSGIYWQYPLNNWGKYPGYKIQGGASALSFWARGSSGGERAEFKVGGTNTPGLPNKDSFGPEGDGVTVLTKEWKQYSIALKGKDLSNLVGGFCWATNTSQNPRGCTIYVDDIEIVP